MTEVCKYIWRPTVECSKSYNPFQIIKEENWKTVDGSKGTISFKPITVYSNTFLKHTTRIVQVLHAAEVVQIWVLLSYNIQSMPFAKQTNEKNWCVWHSCHISWCFNCRDYEIQWDGTTAANEYMVSARMQAWPSWGYYPILHLERLKKIKKTGVRTARNLAEIPTGFSQLWE